MVHATNLVTPGTILPVRVRVPDLVAERRRHLHDFIADLKRVVLALGGHEDAVRAAVV